MLEQTIICPNCGKKIPLSKALTGQIEKKLRKGFETEFHKRERETEASYKRKLTAELARLEKQARKEAETTAAKELAALRKQIVEAQKREQASKLSFERKLATEISRLEKQARKKAEDATEAKLADLRKQLRDRGRQLKDIRKQEQVLKKLQDKLEAKEKVLDQKVKKERRKITDEITEKLTEEYKAKEREDAKKLSEMRKQLIGLKLKLEQSSQQRQGAVGEEELVEMLRKNFPYDKIEPVGKGKTGVDLLQRVYTQSGQYCGTIVWESKKTKVWSKGWLSKLRSDQRKVKAELAVLASNVLPKNISHFAYLEGVWITEFNLVVGVAMALRSNLIQVMLTKGLSKSKNIEVKEKLYDYVTGTQFKHRVEAIIESFRSMQDDLNKEKQAIEKNWARREKQIQAVIENIAGMYGDMQGMGTALQKIRRLELLPGL